MSGLTESPGRAPLTVDEARRHILDQLTPLGPESRMLADARGGVLAESIRAPIDAPAFDRSAMDGYAVAWNDVQGVTESSPVELPVAFEVPAGPVGARRLAAGEAARIMTGGRIPDGADTVIIQEVTREDAGQVTILELGKGPGHYVRKQGSYFAAGQELARRGQAVDPGMVGLLASIGCTVVQIHRRPRVAIVSTGDELVELHERPGLGQIRNSNAHMLAALVAESGGVPLLVPIARDTVAHCRKRFEQALGAADLVVSIGGVSVGDYDVVRRVMLDLGAGMGFWKVNMKPGKPLAFGLLSGIPTIGLPGNPVSSFVAFYQFVHPAIRRLRGFVDSGRLAVVEARLRCELRSTTNRVEYQRGLLCENERGLEFEPFVDQDSGNLTSIVNTSGFGIVAGDTVMQPAGDPIVVERIPGAPIFKG